MAQSGFTPIQLFRTTTAAAVPTAGSLADGELAINLTDEKLYFKNASGTVKLLASSGGASGTVTSVDVSGGTTGLTFSGGPITSSGTITMAGTLGVANGGTGASSLTSGYLLKGNGTSAVSASVVYDDGTNVGIGTASPTSLGANTAALSLNSTAANTSGGVVFQSGGSQSARLAVLSGWLSLQDLGSANGLAIDEQSNLPITFKTNATERMRIDSSGNVGIGTSSPSVRLSVSGDGKFTNTANTQVNIGGGTGQGQLIVEGPPSAATSLSLLENASGAYVTQSGGSSGFNFRNTDGDYSFSTGAGNTERMRITSAGNVGIGVTPSTWTDFTALQVGALGGAALGGLANNTILTSNAYYNSGFKYAASGAGATYYQQTSSEHRWFTAPSGTAGNAITFTERMRITSAGFVGIGTSSPSSKLTVLDGDIEISTAAAGNTLLSFNGTTANLTVNSSSAPLVFGTNSTERMRITSAGNVGIGTTSPAEKLSIVGNIELALGANRSVNIGSSTNYFYALSAVGDDFQIIEAGTTPRLTIKYPSGNVGIGTSSPGRKLTVATSGENFQLRVGDNNTVGVYDVGRDATTGTFTIYGNQTGFTSFAFGGVDGERMRITASGDVGIGTSSPGVKLDVNGVVRSNAWMFITPNTGTDNALYRASNTGGTAYMGLDNSAGGLSGAAYALSLYHSGAYPIVLSTNGSERMRITSTGLVGIGTSTPQRSLGIGGSANAYMNFNPTSFRQYTVGSDANGYIVFDDTAGVYRMVVDGSGNVGIGTASPSYRLHVNSGAATTVGFFQSTGTSSFIGLSNASYTTYLGSFNDGSFRIQTPGSGFSDKVTVDISGNVGIGTASPPTYAGYGNLAVEGTNGATFQLRNSAGTNISEMASAAGEIYLKAILASPLWFGTNNTERMRITSAGDVGIGTSSITAGYKLDVAGSANASGSFVSGGGTTNQTLVGNKTLLFYNTSVSEGVIQSADDSSTFTSFGISKATLRFLTLDTERMRIGSDGNVGIGTSNPGAKLEVSNGASECQVRIRGGTAGATSPQLQFYGNSSDHNWTLVGNHSAALQFFKGTFGSLGSELMRLDINGNLGVGTTTPISGAGLTIGNDGNGSATVKLSFSTSTTERAFISMAGGSGEMRYSAGYGGYGGFSTFYTAGSERMRIDASGNLLVGTTSATAGYLMSVNGALTLANGYSLSWGAYNSGGPTIAGSTNFLAFYPNGASSGEKMRISSTGIVGIGVVPGANDFTGTVQTGWVGHGITPRTSTNLVFNMNANHNAGDWRYGNTGAAALYIQSDAGHAWYNAPSGTAGNAISFNEAMRIDASGNVAIGTSSTGGGRLTVAGGNGIIVNGNGASGYNVAQFINDGSITMSVGVSGSTAAGWSQNLAHLGTTSNSPLAFGTNSTERFRILAGGGITSSDLADAVGYKGLPQNSQTTGYTLALSDMGKHISITTGNITIPANGSVAFPVGAAVTIYNNSGSTQTISITTDTLRQAGTTNTGTRTLAAYGVATVLKVASTTWVISGNVS